MSFNFYDLNKVLDLCVIENESFSFCWINSNIRLLLPRNDSKIILTVKSLLCYTNMCSKDSW